MKYKILPFAASIFVIGSLMADDYYYKSGTINSGSAWAKGSWDGPQGDMPGANDTAYFTTQSMRIMRLLKRISPSATSSFRI